MKKNEKSTSRKPVILETAGEKGLILISRRKLSEILENTGICKKNDGFFGLPGANKELNGIRTPVTIQIKPTLIEPLPFDLLKFLVYLTSK